MAPRTEVLTRPRPLTARHTAGVALATGLIGLLASCSSGSTHAKAGTTSAAAAKSGGTATSAPASNSSPPETNVPGDIPDNQAFVTFDGPGCTIKFPEGWAMTRAASVVTFSDRFNAERLENGVSSAPPTVLSVRTTSVPRLRAATPGFALRHVSTVARPGGTAVLTRYRATSAPDPVTNKAVALDVERYDFWRNGKLVTVTLSAPTGSDNVDPWKTITDSLLWRP